MATIGTRTRDAEQIGGSRATALDDSVVTDEAGEEEEDEDGLGRASSPTSTDRHYLEEAAGGEGEEERGRSAASVQQWKVQHGPGDFKYPGTRLGEAGEGAATERHGHC